MKKNYISTVEKVNRKFHRSNVIIHDGSYYFAEFHDMEQLKRFSEMLGFSYKLTKEENTFLGEKNKYCEYEIDREIISPCNGGFGKLSDLPDGVKPFKALSNGRIVDCFFLNDGEKITIYRPNPNAKDIYKPLSVDEHINFVKNNYLC
jgi:hypothetical protein